jgi:hypothetical protein
MGRLQTERTSWKLQLCIILLSKKKLCIISKKKLQLCKLIVRDSVAAPCVAAEIASCRVPTHVLMQSMHGRSSGLEQQFLPSPKASDRERGGSMDHVAALHSAGSGGED